ncbi:hypothetical protein [Sphingomonas sp.]
MADNPPRTTGDDDRRAREALLTALRAVRDDRKALDAWRNRGKECRILR